MEAMGVGAHIVLFGDILHYAYKSFNIYFYMCFLLLYEVSCFYCGSFMLLHLFVQDSHGCRVSFGGSKWFGKWRCLKIPQKFLSCPCYFVLCSQIFLLRI